MYLPRPTPLLNATFGCGFTVARVTPAELTHANADRLTEELAALARSGPWLVADLGAVSFLGSGGLSALLAAHRRVREAGGRLTLVNVGPQLQKVLAVTQLDTVLDFRPARLAA